MSKKADPTKIGLFIVIGLVLSVAAIITFSSAKFFTPTKQCILYFDASVKGLNVGAPVKLRGVTIGSVIDVMIHFNQAENDTAMPVLIELNQDMLQAKTDKTINFADPESLAAAVKRGLRGSLQAQSLVTGLLYVELEVLPDAPPPDAHQVKPIYGEIPTVPTDIQELMANLAKVDLAGISDKLNAILSKLEVSLDQLQVKQVTDNLNHLLTSVDRLVTSPDLTNAVASAHKTLDELRLLSEKIRAKVDPVTDSATSTLDKAGETLAEVREGVENLRDMLDPEAPVRRDLHRAVEELSRAARSISILAEFLTRNPNALILGREPNPSNP